MSPAPSYPTHAEGEALYALGWRIADDSGSYPGRWVKFHPEDVDRPMPEGQRWRRLAVQGDETWAADLRAVRDEAPAATEPFRWLVEDDGDVGPRGLDFWYTDDSADADGWRAKGLRVTALYTAPPAASPAPQGDAGGREQDAAWCDAQAAEVAAAVELARESSGGVEIEAHLVTAVEADVARFYRIAAALREPAAAPVDGRVRELVEALHRARPWVEFAENEHDPREEAGGGFAIRRYNTLRAIDRALAGAPQPDPQGVTDGERVADLLDRLLTCICNLPSASYFMSDKDEAAVREAEAFVDAARRAEGERRAAAAVAQPDGERGGAGTGAYSAAERGAHGRLRRLRRVQGRPARIDEVLTSPQQKRGSL